MRKAIWQFLNYPLVVAFLTVLFILVLFRVGAGWIFLRADIEELGRNRIEALGRLELVSFSEVEVPVGNPQKFVGEFRNHSRFVVDNVQGTVCFFSAGGELVDVISRRLEGIGYVAPGESRRFYLERSNDRGSWEVPEPATRDGVRTTITFVNLDATKAE